MTHETPPDLYYVVGQVCTPTQLQLIQEFMAGVDSLLVTSHPAEVADGYDRRWVPVCTAEELPHLCVKAQKHWTSQESTKCTHYFFFSATADRYWFISSDKTLCFCYGADNPNHVSNTLYVLYHTRDNDIVRDSVLRKCSDGTLKTLILLLEEKKRKTDGTDVVQGFIEAHLYVLAELKKRALLEDNNAREVNFVDSAVASAVG